MAKKQAPNKLTKEQEQLVRKIQQYILSNNSSIINIRGVKNAIADEDDGFFFKNNDAANKEATRLINEMARKIDGLLLTGIEKAWKIGNDDLENNIKSGLTSSQRDKKLLDEISKQATQSARVKTAENYYKQKVDGLNISDRVWNLAGNAKKEIEIIVQNGIKEGKGADEIQKSIRGYLNEPDKLFRRVLNKKTGEYELSKAAKKYHPGQGVYRSAYKNAMRLARTELKAASCEAAWLSAQNNPLIVGWKIVLSNNHTMLVKGVPVKFKDICDELQGTYPKSFKFKGWHPQCRCEMLPVLISKNERVDLYKSIFDKKREGFNPKVITDVPDNFNKWVEENKKRQTASSATPYFVRDNFKGGLLLNGLSIAPKPILKQEIKNIKEDVDIIINNEEIEYMLNIKRGEPMSFEDANELRGNVDYEKGGGYHYNCQAAVVANELRRRGFDVTALENTRQKDNIPYRLSLKTELAWIDKETGITPVKQKAGGISGVDNYGRIKSKTIKQLSAELADLVKEIGRYHIDFAWKGTRSGHIICLEKLSNGKVRFYDPQNGKLVSWADLSKRISLKHGVNVLRVDNLMINKDLINGIVVKL